MNTYLLSILLTTKRRHTHCGYVLAVSDVSTGQYLYLGQIILQPVSYHVSHFLGKTEDKSMRYFFLTESNISFWKIFLYVFIVFRWTPSIYSSIIKCKLKDKTKTFY